MRSANIGHHISRRFNAELEGIHDKVLAMGGLVEQQFKYALQAFMNGNIALAEKVIQQDKQVDNDEMTINQECSKILACRQPEAFDLRMLIAIIKTITELERIGDITVHIASRAIHICDIEKKSESFHEVQDMYDLVKAMLHGALNAYAHLNSDGILDITAQDNNVNREYNIIFQQLVARMVENPHSIKHTMNVMFIVKDIERIAEKSVQICKNVVYLIKGENIDHMDIDEIAQKLGKQGER